MWSGIWRAADNCTGMGKEPTVINTEHAGQSQWFKRCSGSCSCSCSSMRENKVNQHSRLTRTLTMTGPPLAVAGRPTRPKVSAAAAEWSTKDKLRATRTADVELSNGTTGSCGQRRACSHSKLLLRKVTGEIEGTTSEMEGILCP